MNRDELLTRGTAQPPGVHEIVGTNALFPMDVEGGTWIAATDHGNTFALLNRNGGLSSSKNLSRGQLVLGAVATQDFGRLPSLLVEVGLFNFLPFRLVGISLMARRLHEWVWDGNALATLEHAWRPTHWFSSGMSDAKATEQRGKSFQTANLAADAGSLAWLRRMHASHGTAPGAFSVCVHRDDAATVSYTEIEVGDGSVKMRYRPGSPCLEGAFQEISIPLAKAELPTPRL